MPDREKVIKGLEMCKIMYCDECPYDDEDNCHLYLNQDALELLKEQESAYENGFNDAMQGKQELMYEGVDGKWYKKAW